MFSASPVFFDEKMDAIRVEQALEGFLHRQPRDRIDGNQGDHRGRNHGELIV